MRWSTSRSAVRYATAATALRPADRLTVFTDRWKIAMAAAAAVVFFIALIVVTVITMKLADFIIDSRVGALDRTLGFLYGAARGILVVAVALLFFNWLVGSNPPTWVTQAKSRPLLDDIGKRIEAMLPADAENSILKRLKPETVQPGTDNGGDTNNGGDGGGDNDTAPAPDNGQTNGQTSG